MTRDFENRSYDEAARIAILENRAAELERRLLAVMRPDGFAGWANVATPANPGPGHGIPDQATEDDDACAGEPEAYLDYSPPGADSAIGEVLGSDEDDGAPDDQDAGVPSAGGRTEALLNHGRPRARRSRGRRLLAHWRLFAVGAVALLAGTIATLVATSGSSSNWPASVVTVQAEIKQACANPDVAAEPSGLNFACAKDTQQVLWVFSLLTSGDNPGFVDQSTGRKGLEPIQPSQGGDIAWSLNLHHPYDPASPVDSLSVAARAINNIISGATLTSATGSALVEPGLESKAANCQRYTGSPQLVTRSGYPASCASPVSSPSGEAALVSDVFQQWMGGTPAQIASEAGVLFENADNPGNPQVQAILASLPASGG
jgi:hypothetical protein